MTERELIEMLRNNPELQIPDDGSRNYLPSIQDNGDRNYISLNKAAMPKLSEHEMQCAIFTKFNERAILRCEYSLIFAIPNGGHRHPAVAANLKAEGVKAGVLDFMVPVARHGYHGCFVELKVGDNKPLQLQNDWIRNLTAEGYLCKVFWDDVDEVVGFIEWYLEGK